MNALTVVLVAAVVTGIGIRTWLSRRQVAHVLAHRGQVPSAFSGRVGLDVHQKAADYTVTRARVRMVEAAWDAVLVLVLTVGGGLEVLARAWGRTGLPSMLVGLGFLGSVMVVGGLAALPFSAYGTFGVEGRFGFNHTTARLFVADTLKQALLAVALGLPLAAGLLFLVGLAGQAWWIMAWAAWMAFTLALTWAYPAFIAPRFNTFRPLEDEALARRVAETVARCGFEARGVFVMDGSRRSAHGNAYFTGFGRQKRIVFFDTLLARLDPAEVEAVLAHELGHFRLHHITKQIVLTAVLALAGLALLGWLVDQPWFYSGLGVEQSSRHAAIGLFAVAGPVAMFFFLPLFAALSRRFEAQADDFAVERSEPGALATALVSLVEQNASTLTPDPLYSAFFDSHPPAGARVARLEGRPAPPVRPGAAGP